MSATLVLGTQWGDEGKAKFIDYFSNKIDIIARFQGGANAGHTVKVGDNTYIFHLIPSGILYPNSTCVLGNGVVIDPQALLAEIKMLEEKKIPNIRKRLIISSRSHVVLPIHKELDRASEEVSGANKIGTTLRGIGFCYGDKIMRNGIRIVDLLNPNNLEERVKMVLESQNQILEKIYGIKAISSLPVLDMLKEFSECIAPMIKDTSIYLNQELKNGKNLLLEGAQGTGLDIDFGTYPYVTSSNTTTGGAISGSGVSFQHIKEVVGICKAYVTRVGEGPFPTELFGEEGEKLRKVGNEFGATTGRPRRCGYFDVELLRHSARINGLTSIALTKIDVLSNYSELKIGVFYKKNGKKLEGFLSASDNDKIEVEYETLPGWKKDIRSARKMEDLPKECRQYIDRLAELIEVPIKFVSVGPDREDTISIS